MVSFELNDTKKSRRKTKKASQALTSQTLNEYLKRYLSGTEPKKKKNIDDDLSPPRKPVKGEKKGPLDDLSPVRQARPSPIADLSPPRRIRKTSPDYLSPPRRASKRSLEPDISHISRGQFGSSHNSSTRRREKLLEWGKGLAQKREAEERGKELEREKERPFARSRDDPELEKKLKERLRWGDPMAHLVKRKTSELILEDFAENEKMKESGFMVPQTIPSHSWLKRGLDFPPNRYGIKPGRHWDGVYRSNSLCLTF